MASKTKTLEYEIAKTLARAYDPKLSWELWGADKDRWLRAAKVVVLLYLTPLEVTNTPKTRSNFKPVDST